MTMTTLPTVTASTSSAMPPKPVQPFTSKIPRYTSRATTVAPLSPSRVVRTTPVDSLSLAPPNKRQIPKAKGLVRPTPRPPVPPKNSSGIPCSGNRVRWLPEMISTPVHYKGPIKGIIKMPKDGNLFFDENIEVDYMWNTDPLDEDEDYQYPPRRFSDKPCTGYRVEWLEGDISEPEHYKGPVKGIVKLPSDGNLFVDLTREVDWQSMCWPPIDEEYEEYEVFGLYSLDTPATLPAADISDNEEIMDDFELVTDDLSEMKDELPPWASDDEIDEDMEMEEEFKFRASHAGLISDEMPDFDLDEELEDVDTLRTALRFAPVIDEEPDFDLEGDDDDNEIELGRSSQEIAWEESNPAFDCQLDSDINLTPISPMPTDLDIDFEAVPIEDIFELSQDDFRFEIIDNDDQVNDSEDIMKDESTVIIEEVNDVIPDDTLCFIIATEVADPVEIDTAIDTLSPPMADTETHFITVTVPTTDHDKVSDVAFEPTDIDTAPSITVSTVDEDDAWRDIMSQDFESKTFTEAEYLAMPWLPRPEDGLHLPPRIRYDLETEDQDSSHVVDRSKQSRKFLRTPKPAYHFRRREKYAEEERLRLKERRKAIRRDNHHFPRTLHAELADAGWRLPFLYG